jgi:hypothetical protein
MIQQLIRVRSRDGNFRFELQPTDDISVLAQKVSFRGQHCRHVDTH